MNLEHVKRNLTKNSSCNSFIFVWILMFDWHHYNEKNQIPPLKSKQKAQTQSCEGFTHLLVSQSATLMYMYHSFTSKYEIFTRVRQDDTANMRLLKTIQGKQYKTKDQYIYRRKSLPIFKKKKHSLLRQLNAYCKCANMSVLHERTSKRIN